MRRQPNLAKVIQEEESKGFIYGKQVGIACTLRNRVTDTWELICVRCHVLPLGSRVDTRL